MDLVKSILDIALCLCDCGSRHAAYIQELQKNVESLREALEDLKNVRNDVRRRVQREEEGYMRVTDEVVGWLRSVQMMEGKVNGILQKGDQAIQKKCLGTCCPNCWSSYKIGKTVSEKLGDVTELRNRGNFEVVAERPPQDPVDERPMEKTVGLDSIYARVCRSIQNEEWGIIGLYGMGGAGKTTLMTKVNNEYIKTSNSFEVAIWTVVSKPASVEKLQEAIRNKLEIPQYKWMNRSEDEKAVQIYNILKNKRFALLLDDVWERLDLQRVGVPLPDDKNKSKVIITTRSPEVARANGAQKVIKVECLTPGEALNLFKIMVGEDTLNSHPHIPDLAQVVANECKGLPLALVTVGRAMAGKRTPEEWDRAIEVLSTYAANFQHIEEAVFPVLKFSYDNLKSNIIQSCFRYFAIFREDYEILNDDLIDLWIGEGFLDEVNSSYRDQGNEIIQTLKAACLFESGSSESCVRMHDVIRDMALWLTRECGANTNKLFIQEGIALGTHEKWREAERVSLWNCYVEELTEPPPSPYLSTLIVKDEELKAFPQGFFQLMHVIKVLDLSGTPSITQLPVGIDKLETLEYLNLSNTELRDLPMELKNLAKMRCLILNDMLCLQVIPLQIISCFPLLQIFSLSWVNVSSYDIMEANYLLEDNKTLLDKVECLEQLKEVSIPITSALSFRKFLGSQKLQRTIRWLSIENMEGETLLQLPFSSQERMIHLEKLVVQKCMQLAEIQIDSKKKKGREGSNSRPHPISNSRFCRLRHLIISLLPKLLDITCLIYIQKLERLEIFQCGSLEEVIHDDCGVSEVQIFSRLKYLRLDFLPSLRSIYGRALQFPSLREIHVQHCISLRKLPFDSNTASKSLKLIKGSSRWWEGLQWDESLKHTFAGRFVPSD